MNAAPASAPENDPHFVGGIVRETPEDAAAIDALVIAGRRKSNRPELKMAS